MSLRGDPGGRPLLVLAWLNVSGPQLLTGMVTVPAGDLHHLVQDDALALLRRIRIRLGVLLGDLVPGSHRQILDTRTPSWPDPPLAGKTM